jgi:hypothetical protein
MKIKLSPHSKKRIKQRKIKVAEIRLTLISPDRKFFVGRNRIIVRKKIRQKELEVIYVIENRTIVIVTLYYL